MDPITQFIFEMNSQRTYRRRAEVIIVHGNKVYAGRKPNGQLLIPGGGLGKNETPSEAAKREAREEIGINCENLKQLAPKLVITWPDIFGGEEEKLSEKHKSWLRAKNLLGHITYSFRGDYTGESEAKTNLGPSDDHYKSVLIDPKEWIAKLEEENKKITDPKVQWRKTWNNYTIELLKATQKQIG